MKTTREGICTAVLVSPPRTGLLLLAAGLLLGSSAGLRAQTPEWQWVPPESVPQNATFFSLKIMPFWLSLWALLYAAGALLVLVSRRIERATMRGFYLWSSAQK